MRTSAPSPDRVAPACRHFGECGGCTSQHWAAKPYLDWKAELVRVQLSHEGLEAEILRLRTQAGKEKQVAHQVDLNLMLKRVLAELASARQQL